MAVWLVATAGCGGAGKTASSERTTTGGGEAAAALRYLRLVGSDRWRDAAALESPDARSDAIDRDLHENIRELGVRLAQRPVVSAGRVTLHLSGKQRLRVNGVYVGTRRSTMVVTVTLTRSPRGRQVSAVEQHTAGRIEPPKH